MTDIHGKKRRRNAAIFSLFLLGTSVCSPVRADALTESGIFSTVGETATVHRLTDKSGNFLLESDGLYCMDAAGSLHKQECVHYFRHMELEGITLDGYYYHDASGKFRPGHQGVKDLSGLSQGARKLDGYYYVGNLGALTAAPQVRYIKEWPLGDTMLDGYYYFDRNGRLDTKKRVHSLHMTCNGREFHGEYYFGGENGRLGSTSSFTEDGQYVDSDGKVLEAGEVPMAELQKEVGTLLEKYSGEWSIYVEDVETKEKFVLNDRPVYPASVIKAFVMAKTFADWEDVLEHEAAVTENEKDAREKVQELLEAMITVSDNESCNELVRLQDSGRNFGQGCVETNEWLKEQGYTQTGIYYTLHPSASVVEAAPGGGDNTTTASDCGRLLEEIYEGRCVSEKASKEMLNLLKGQQVVHKIPGALPEEVETANKTGETSSTQHDIAIVYGPETTYILCVLSENCPSESEAVEHIHEISQAVYEYLNPEEAAEKEEERP